MNDAPISARLCGFEYYSGIPDDHECDWLRGKSTVEFAVPKAADGGCPSWVMGATYVIVPVPEGTTAEDVLLRINGQTSLFDGA